MQLCTLLHSILIPEFVSDIKGLVWIRFCSLLGHVISLFGIATKNGSISNQYTHGC